MNGSGAVPSQLDASGIFETCRVREGRVLRLEEHLRRLGNSLKTAGIFDWDLGEVRRELARSARGLREGYVRIAVRRRGSPRVQIHRQAGSPYPKEWRRRGIAVRTVPTRWPAGETGWAQAKTSERLSGILSRAEAPGVPEALRIGPHGYVTEGTVSNLFFVKEGTLVTAPAWLGVLEGVTRAEVIRAAERMRLRVQEVPFSRHDLFNAEEVFLTNVLMGILPVRELDGRRIGGRIPGLVTRKLAWMIGKP